MAEELERTSGSTSESATKSTKRGTYEKYTPKEKAETSCYAWYHSHNKASPCLAKLCSNHEIFITKINKFANLECFTKFLCLENLELYGMPFAFNTREQKLYYTETGPTVFEVNNRVHLCACMFIQYHGDLAGTCLYLMQVWKAFFIHTSTLH